MIKGQLHMIWPERLLNCPPQPSVPQGYELRIMDPKDADDLVRLMRAAGFLAWSEDNLKQSLQKALPGGFFVIACKATGNLAASATAQHNPLDAHPSGGELGWVAASPAHSGMGLGMAVCAAATRRFVQAGYSRIFLRTDDHRLAALKTYLRLGYVPYLHAWDMEERWKTIFEKLAMPCNPSAWPRAPDRIFVRKPAAQDPHPWRETTRQDRNMKIFREELDEFLPPRILDFHVHVMNEGVIPLGDAYRCGGHALTRYDFSDLNRDLAELYPGRQSFAVCFGFPNPQYNRRANDDFVGQNCDKRRFFPFRLFDPENDTEESLRNDIAKHGFVGLKPYLDYVKKADRSQIEVREMLPDWAMRVADELGLIVMLHIPRNDRLADPLNRKQVADLCCRYPGARLVLAHIGRAYYLRNIVGCLDDIKDLPNLWYDTAMLNNWEVLEYLFNIAPPEKILYGTDIPIALAPGKSVEINDQYTYVTPVPWKLSISDDHRKLVFTSFLYEELRAIKKAVERLGPGRAFVEGLFYGNGMTLLRSATRGRLSADKRT